MHNTLNVCQCVLIVPTCVGPSAYFWMTHQEHICLMMVQNKGIGIRTLQTRTFLANGNGN
jgi:hypothetical protein